jgi:hypothetical protein
MKPHTEMNEGPPAFKRFRAAMKAIVAVPKTVIIEADKKKAKKRKKAKVSASGRASSGSR